MSDPMLREKKFLKPVLHILEERSHDRNSIVRQMAVRGLGNLVYGAPEKVKKHKKFLMVILIRALSDPFSSEVIGESMKAVAKVLKELKEKDRGSSFRDLTQQIRTYFDNNYYSQPSSIESLGPGQSALNYPSAGNPGNCGS
ncbi:protein maestro-like [Chelonia mydas]|uniref:protein maestro-like n=1 Tax=Chelonia mydas TaxID=8469 RepID=UPI001CA9CD06|nr:protein maestro-like [Chelonia mydas]